MSQASDPVDRLVAKAKVSRRVQLAAIRLLGLQAHYAKRVLCDDQGQIKPEAELLLAMLAREAKLHQHGFTPEADRRLFDAGGQHIVRLLMDWTGMDSARLARLQQRLHDEMKG